MHSEEQKQFTREVIAKQQALINKSEWICCGNCDYLQLSEQGKQHCTLYDCLPPLAVLTVGCESWTDVDVPF